MEAKIFKDIPKDISVKDKIEILIKRHENKYFIDKDLESIDPSLSAYIRPINKVTKKNLHLTVSYDMQAKVKKIHWVLTCEKKYAAQVKRKYENNEFKSFKDIDKESALIYEKYCENYCKSKATVSSVNGKKVHRKKGSEVDNIKNDTASENSNEQNLIDQEILKRKLSNELKNNVDIFFEISNLSNDELKSRIKAHERFDEISKIPALSNPTSKDSRQIFLTLASVLDLINKDI
ncbi:unnamed protein product [Brachionus calyciflorus]|uniref:Uncharacterized protein n=1 Tax=Brachionus calyciflorus TaxID=104777 RepID=A0A813XPK1_9BILA|nr:unnamed protein product [Brachionus calyciflorus]